MYTHQVSYSKFNKNLDMMVQVSYRTTEDAIEMTLANLKKVIKREGIVPGSITISKLV